MSCRFIWTLVLLGAAIAPAAAAAAGDETQKLQPGKTPGTFHLIYRGSVGFTMNPEFPTIVSIKSELRGTVAKRTVTSGDPFTLEADLPPGVYWVESAPLQQPGLSDYQAVNGGQLVIDPQGHLMRQLAWTDRLVHIHTMSGLSPADGAVADSDPPVLKWTKVEGAKFYRVSYKAGTEWKDFKTDALSFTLPQLANGTYCICEIYAQDGQDQTIASGVTDFSSHGTTRPPATEPIPNEAFLGVIFAPSGSSGDPFWTAVLGPPAATTRPVETDPGITVAKVMPDSAASKADVRPGDVIVALNGKPAAKSGRSDNDYDVFAFANQIRAVKPGAVITLTLRRDGEEMKRQITLAPTPPWLIGGVEKMSGLWPEGIEVANDQPVLKWSPVAGAKRYKGAFCSGTLGKVFETEGVTYALPPPPLPDRCAWWVCAIDDKGRTLANGRAAFYCDANDMAGMFPGGSYLGIVPQPFRITKDPNGTRRIGGGVVISRGETIPCIEVMGVMPGSPALKSDIEPGDWIIAIDGKPIATTNEQGIETADTKAVGDQIRAMKPGTVATLTIRRDSKELKIPVTIASAPGAVNVPTTGTTQHPDGKYDR